MRDEGNKVFFQCDTPAAGWEARPGEVLFMVFRAGLWLAMHAPQEACLEDLGEISTASLVFSSPEDISKPGPHQWLAPPVSHFIAGAYMFFKNLNTVSYCWHLSVGVARHREPHIWVDRNGIL